MILTILVGGVSALFSFGGYVLAAPDLASIVAGEDKTRSPASSRPRSAPSARRSSSSSRCSPSSCVLSLQAAASRLLFSFARDGGIPGHRWLAKVSPNTKVPRNALIVPPARLRRSSPCSST